MQEGHSRFCIPVHAFHHPRWLCSSWSPYIPEYQTLHEGKGLEHFTWADPPIFYPMSDTTDSKEGRDSPKPITDQKHITATDDIMDGEGKLQTVLVRISVKGLAKTSTV